MMEKKYVPRAPHYSEPEPINRIVYCVAKGPLVVAVLIMVGVVYLTSAGDEARTKEVAANQEAIHQEAAHEKPAHHSSASRKQHTSP